MKTQSIVRRAAAAVNRHLAGRTRGQSLVEFALIAPLFLLLLLVAIDFGRIFFTYVQLNNAAREAASYAAFNPATADTATLTPIASREKNAQGQRGETAITASATCANSAGTVIPCTSAQGGGGAGNRVTVTVSERFNFFTPLINGLWPPTGFFLGASATAAVVDFAAAGSSGGSSCSTLPPTPTFTWQSPDPANHPFLISVNAGGSSSLASPCQNVGYNWDFGGASTDPSGDYLREGVTQDYEYAAAGVYTVTLTVSNAAGDSTPYSQTITLGSSPCNAPTATITVSPAAIVVGGNITNWTYYKNNGHQGTAFTFDGSTSSFMSDPACHPTWDWDLGDGTAHQTTPTVSGYHYHLAGSSPVTVHLTLTVHNDAGTNSKTVDLPLVQDK